MRCRRVVCHRVNEQRLSAIRVVFDDASGKWSIACTRDQGGVNDGDRAASFFGTATPHRSSASLGL